MVRNEQGLFYYSQEKDVFAEYEIPEITGTVKSIYEDKYGRLWLTSQNKIIIINPDFPDDKIIWDIYDNLRISGFTFNSICEDNRGNIYFGCHDGILKLGLSELTRHDNTSPLYITSFSLNERAGSGPVLENRLSSPTI